MKHIWSSLYTLVLGLWVGGIALFTFLATPAIFRSFNRDMAAQIVDRLFPVYFSYLFALSAIAFAIYILATSAKPALRSWLCLGLLIGAVVISSLVLFKLYPEIAAIKTQVATFERDPDSPARKQFSRMHAVSAVLNLLMLADGISLLLLSPAIRERDGNTEQTGMTA